MRERRNSRHWGVAIRADESTIPLKREIWKWMGEGRCAASIREMRRRSAEKMEDFLVNRARTRDFCPRTNYSITGLITRKRSLFEQRGEGGDVSSRRHSRLFTPRLIFSSFRDDKFVWTEEGKKKYWKSFQLSTNISVISFSLCIK